MRAAKAALICVAVGGAMAPSRACEAVIMHDVLAFGQRTLQLYEHVVKYREMIRAADGQFKAFKQAFEGVKDWKNLSLEDTLSILDAPWFDGVEGIDELRFAATATALTVEQTKRLFSDVKGFGKNNPRYDSDPWYRARIDAILKYSSKARAQKIAIMRQLQAQNAVLAEDAKRITDLRKKVAEENRAATLGKRPVNQAKIGSYQAEIAGIEAKHKGQEMMLRNQQMIMRMVGNENEYWLYMDTTQSDWMDKNTQAATIFGQGFYR